MSELVPVFYADDLRTAIRNIKEGDSEGAIFHLRRAFEGDSGVLELIESEWRKK